MRPFFSYFGAKWRAAQLMPPPEHDLVIEPFAGSAGYAVRHDAPRALLLDLDEHIVGTWQFLIAASAGEIRSLPDLRADQTVDDLGLCQEAGWLIGWWCNNGSATPKRRPSRWIRQSLTGEHGWGAGGRAGWRPIIRERIASQVDQIRGWEARLASYREAPDATATWLIDPPYVEAGHHYRRHDVDHADVAAFALERRGLTITCEAAGAAWLPFRPLATIKATRGTSHEVVHVGRS